MELQTIQADLNHSYAVGDIDLQTFAVGWVLLAYGCRPTQIAGMKESDLIVGIEKNGSKFYALKIPRAKQQGKMFRTTFKTRHCGKQLGALLETLIGYNSRFKIDTSIAADNWPLFIRTAWGRPIRGDLAGYEYHCPSNVLTQKIAQTLGKITRLKANPKRFRITMAQQAVDDGKDKYTLAELLDHSDTQNVGIYFEASKKMVEHLDRHLAMDLAPIAQAFSGVLIMSEAEALRGNDSSSRIYDKTLRNNVDRPLGSCGQMSFCDLLAPVACYICRHFQPWVDAPHEVYMQALIDDRDRMIAQGYSPKIYKIKDRTILAIAEVIQLCEAAKNTETKEAT